MNEGTKNGKKGSWSRLGVGGGPVKSRRQQRRRADAKQSARRRTVNVGGGGGARPAQGSKYRQRDTRESFLVLQPILTG